MQAGKRHLPVSMRQIQTCIRRFQTCKCRLLVCIRMDSVPFGQTASHFPLADQQVACAAADRFRHHCRTHEISFGPPGLCIRQIFPVAVRHCCATSEIGLWFSLVLGNNFICHRRGTRLATRFAYENRSGAQTGRIAMAIVSGRSAADMGRAWSGRFGRERLGSAGTIPPTLRRAFGSAVEAGNRSIGRHV